MGERTYVAIPLEVASIIDRVFLPRNPNKMRGADPAVVDAVKTFRALLPTPTPRKEDGHG